VQRTCPYLTILQQSQFSVHSDPVIVVDVLPVDVVEVLVEVDVLVVDAEVLEGLTKITRSNKSPLGNVLVK